MCPYGALTAPCFEQRVVVDGKIVSQLCNEDGALTEDQFQHAMRKQACNSPERGFSVLLSPIRSNLLCFGERRPIGRSTEG